MCKCLYYWRTAVKTIIFIIIDTISINLTDRKTPILINFGLKTFDMLISRFIVSVLCSAFTSPSTPTRQASLTRLSDFLLDRKPKQYCWCLMALQLGYETNLLRFRQLVVAGKCKIYVPRHDFLPSPDARVKVQLSQWQ